MGSRPLDREGAVRGGSGRGGTTPLRQGIGMGLHSIRVPSVSRPRSAKVAELKYANYNSVDLPSKAGAMMSSSILAQKALAIPAQARQDYLLGIPETELHRHLCRLLENMEEGARCEITHGPEEYGRDIVLRRSSPFGQEYIAIVVKRGDTQGKISGRTAGPVDEIISQVNQSVAQKCHLKEIEIATVDVGEAWVMFFGRLTNSAVKRILAEAPPLRFEPFAIGWLADHFAEFYPEVFFAGDASSYLQNKVIEFETNHDLSRRPENLSEWYVEPSIAITQVDAHTFQDRLKKALNLQRLSYQTFRAHLNQPKHFVLSAAPGFGKTTLLRKLALDLYREALTRTASIGSTLELAELQIPVFVAGTVLSEYDDIESFLDNHLPPEGIRASFSAACLLVDALDEVPLDKQVTTLEFAQAVAKHLNCAMVVSARPVHVVRSLAGASSLRLPVVQLLPFEYNQALRLIDRVVRDAEIVNILKEGIESVQAHMALSPLSVSLLLDIAEAEREVPGTIGEIFDQYMDIALGRYDIERGLDVVFQYFIKKQVLSELAWFEFFEKDRLAIAETEFDNFLSNYFELRGLDIDAMPRMKADIDRSGILRFSDGVYFAHRAFLDFYVALYVSDHGEQFPNIVEWLAETYFSDKWSEVTFYYFAHRREFFSDFLIEAARMENDNVDYHIRRYLIGRLLQAGWLSPSQTKIDGIRFGISSGAKLFEMISNEVERDTPQAMPYGIMAALAESSYSSRTLHRDVSRVIEDLTASESIEDFRNALSLLWANRTRVPTAEAVAQGDRVLGLLARLEKSEGLLLADKAVGFLLLESIVEDDKKSQRAISRKVKKLIRAQPSAIKKLFGG